MKMFPIIYNLRFTIAFLHFSGQPQAESGIEPTRYFFVVAILIKYHLTIY